MFVIQLDDSNGKSFSTSSAQGKMTAKQIQALPETEFIEPVQEYHALSMDSQYPYQWSLNNTGKMTVLNTPIFNTNRLKNY